MQPQDIEQLIEQHIPQSTATVTSDDGRHFEATVVSDTFLNKSLVAQQQLVYHALGEHITNGSIHALSLKTMTQRAWQEGNQTHG